MCMCVRECMWMTERVCFHTFDECIWMTETMWFHTVWNTIIYWWMYVNYWNKFCLHTKFDVVNPIIKLFGLLIAWKFVRMKTYCNFQKCNHNFAHLKIITFLDDVSEYLKKNGLLFYMLNIEWKTFWSWQKWKIIKMNTLYLLLKTWFYVLIQLLRIINF